MIKLNELGQIEVTSHRMSAETLAIASTKVWREVDLVPVGIYGTPKGLRFKFAPCVVPNKGERVVIHGKYDAEVVSYGY